MYSFDSRIRYSEVDSQRHVTLPSIIDYFQDCSNFQSEELGVGIDYLIGHGLVWVLSSWQIEVSRYPQMGEHVKVSTWPYGFKGFFGYRNFTMEDDAGELLAYANSVWTLLDVEKGRPARLTPEMQQAYQLSPQLELECESRKVAFPQEMEAREPFPVHKYHIDTNNHVNNGKYVSMAQEYLPMGFCTGKLRVEYRKAAVYRDIIFPFVAKEKEKIIVKLADEEGNPYAIVELEEKKCFD